MDLRHPRIWITHSPAFKRQAADVSRKYQSLGAVLKVEEEEAYEKVRHLKGHICYFENNRRVKKIAEVLAKDLRKFQKVSPIYVETPNPAVDFTIYLIAKPANKPAVKSVFEHPQTNDELKNAGLEKCRYCNSYVSLKRIERHILRVHGSGIVRPRTERRKLTRPAQSVVPRKLVYIQSPDRSRLNPRLLGKPSISGDRGSIRYKPLKPRAGVSSCRICGRGYVMYNGLECYTCNPK